MSTRYSGLTQIAGLVKAAQEYTPLMRTADERFLPDGSGATGIAGAIAAPIAAYTIPGVRTLLPAYNTVADVANIFSPGASAKQRLGHAGSAVVDAGFTGLGLISDLGTFLTGGLGAAPTAALTGGARALRAGLAAKKLHGLSKFPVSGAGKYLRGHQPWQRNIAAWAQGHRGTGSLNPLARGLTMGERGQRLSSLGHYAPAAGGAWLAGSPWSHGMIAGGISGAMAAPSTPDPARQSQGPQAQGGAAPFGTGGFFEPQQTPGRYRGLGYMNPYDDPNTLPFSGTSTPSWLR